MNKESLISKEDYVFYEDKRIWSKLKEKFLKGYIKNNGYVQVYLKCIDGKQRRFLWHRVIWYMFNGEIPDGYEINHIDENKQNNALSNLNLITHKENNNWGTRNQRSAAKQSKQVVAVDEDNNVVYEFASTQEAGRQGFKSSNVSACCRNCYTKQNINYYKGYYWFFKYDWEQIQNAAPRKRETAYQLEINLV